MGQKLELPITLADYYSPSLVLFAAVVPAAVFAAVDYAVLRARRTSRRQRFFPASSSDERGILILGGLQTGGRVRTLTKRPGV